MESILIKSIIGLVVILSILIFFFVYSSNKKSEKIALNDKKPNKPSLIDLKRTIKNEKTTSEGLTKALDLVLQEYPHIGINDEQTLNIYMLILMAICRHPHTNKNIIINFEKELVKLNPSYEAEIHKAIIAGLDSRS